MTAPIKTTCCVCGKTGRRKYGLEDQPTYSGDVYACDRECFRTAILANSVIRSTGTASFLLYMESDPE